MSLVSAKCPNCGASIQVDNERKEAFCSYCGSKVEVKEAIGMVRIDNSEELANLYQVARRAKDQDNSENAAKYYDQILVKDPNSWEANFYVVYYQAMQCKIAEIASAAQSVINNVKPVLGLIKDCVTDEKEQSQAVDEVCSKLNAITSMLYVAAENHYNGIDEEIRHNFAVDFVNNVSSATKIQKTLGDLLIEYFGDVYSSQAVTAWKGAVEKHGGYVKFFGYSKAVVDASLKEINGYVAKIKKYDASYTPPVVNLTPPGGGCYVATAVYGSYDCPEVWTLRRFRDYSLSKTLCGRTFIRTYYAISPTLVKWFGSANWFQKTWRFILDKFVSKLKSLGFEDSPYDDGHSL